MSEEDELSKTEEMDAGDSSEVIHYEMDQPFIELDELRPFFVGTYSNNVCTIPCWYNNSKWELKIYTTTDNATFHAIGITEQIYNLTPVENPYPQYFLNKNYVPQNFKDALRTMLPNNILPIILTPTYGARLLREIAPVSDEFVTNLLSDVQRFHASYGFIHGDINEDNILVLPDRETAMLINLSGASFTDTYPALTHTNPRYLPPEELAFRVIKPTTQDEPVLFRVDQWGAAKSCVHYLYSQEIPSKVKRPMEIFVLNVLSELEKYVKKKYGKRNVLMLMSIVEPYLRMLLDDYYAYYQVSGNFPQFIESPYLRTLAKFIRGSDQKSIVRFRVELPRNDMSGARDAWKTYVGTNILISPVLSAVLSWDQTKRKLPIECSLCENVATHKCTDCGIKLCGDHLI